MLSQLAAKLGGGHPHPSEIVGATETEYEQARRRFEQLLGGRRDEWTGTFTADDPVLGALDTEAAGHLYALIRCQGPDVVVETGVCNGVSSLAILHALDHNGHGQLHSVDLPFRADEDLDEFRAETFDDYGGAAIPADRDPGWIVPDRLRDRWDLRIGKSQHELPQLLPEIGPVDVFLHDSEHSHPCQMFEYELGWHHLGNGGLLMSDDTSWTDAFETFIDVRGDGAAARPADGMGVIRKPAGE
jgi:hypothetical protein